MTAFILTNFKTDRLLYITEWIFHQNIGISVKIIHSLEDFNDETGILINYGNNDCIEADINIPDIGLLSQTGVNKHHIDSSYIRRHIEAYSDENNSTNIFDFDLLSITFFLISRYEEYINPDYDSFGRYDSRHSVASKCGVLDRPVIDEWINQLKAFIIREKNITIEDKIFRNYPTIDIDIPYAYRCKGWKNIAALVRDCCLFRKSRVQAILQFLNGGIDPFDTYQYLSDKLKNIDDRIIYFVLMRNHGKFDENHVVEKEVFNSLLDNIKVSNEIGLHPSIYSDGHLDRILYEKNKLEKITSSHIQRSRQHFLLLNVHYTYRILEEAGIKYDYSMQYPDAIGFRASTTLPFNWYDLIENRITGIKIYPGCIMDVTARNYLNVSPQRAIEISMKLKNRVKNVGGDFRWIWHNSSFSRAHGWEDWYAVFEALIE